MRCSSRFGLVAGRGGHQSGVRHARGLGAGALRLSRPAAARCHRRYSVRAADRGCRHRAHHAVCRERLARRAAGAARASRSRSRRSASSSRWSSSACRSWCARCSRCSQDLEAELEEAAATLGASRWQTVRGVIFPALLPALLTGFALAFARAVGEYGSVIFIAGNLPNVSEIAPLLIVIRLEEFRLRRRHRDRRRHAAGSLSCCCSSSTGCSAGPSGAPERSERREAMPRRRAMQASRVCDLSAARRAAAARGRARRTLDHHRASRSLFLAVFLVLPLVAVFAQAFRAGLRAYFAALDEPDALAAIRLTLLVAAIAVPLNLVFGLAAAWAIAKFDFRGKSLLITLIDLPFSVVAGDLRPGLRAAVRRAGLLGAWLPRTTSRSSSRCPASCWRPSSSRSPSSRAS